MSEDRLDQALNAIRSEKVTPEALRQAKARVWNRLAAMQSPACAEFLPELGEYDAGRLKAERKLLVEDHLSRCVACRRALAELRGEQKPLGLPEIRTRRMPTWVHWGAAAAMLLVGIYLGRQSLDRWLGPKDRLATVETVKGRVVLTSGEVLRPGATLGPDQVLRTGLYSGARLKLRDGSLVELNQRTELGLGATLTRTQLLLERGDIIVQASRRRLGRLEVITRDATARVRGTVFAVSSGLAGSLVSVAEGTVEVRTPRGQRLLHKGEKVATSDALEAIPITRAFAWSSDAAKYYQLLNELTAIEKTVSASVPPLGRQFRLLGYMPAGTFMWVAMPNLGVALEQAQQLIEERSLQSPALLEWWGSASAERLKSLLNTIQRLSAHLGDEIVVCAFRPPVGRELVVATLAEVRPGQREALLAAMKQAFGENRSNYTLADNLLVVTDSRPHLEAALASLGSGAGSLFATEVARHYQDQLSLLIAVDAGPVARSIHAGASSLLGSGSIKYLLLEQGAAGSPVGTELSVSFAGPRTGMASWLAEPGAAGSAEYVGADAVVAVSASTRSPKEALEELVSLMSRIQPGLSGQMPSVELRERLHIAEQIASGLGCDFALAIQQPALPLPGWVAAAEVTDQTAVEGGVRNFVRMVNDKLAGAGRPAALRLEERTIDGRRWMVFSFTGASNEIWWTYDRGYLIASRDRSRVETAISTRNSGMPLIRTQAFLERLPRSPDVHPSAFVWVNPTSLTELAQLMRENALKSLLASREPLLVTAVAEREQIRICSRSQLMNLMLPFVLANTGQARSQGGRQAASNGTRR